jgi:penicillin V acylase-like amidase (Ntn superfamily)
MLKDKCTGAIVSSRTLSFPISLDPEVSYVRKGASIALSEVAGTLDAPVWAPYPGKAVTAKHNFVCASVARNQLRGYYGPKSARGRQDWLFCVDGLNDAGLSCNVQYQGLTTKMPRYDAGDKAKPDALNIEDLCAFALARFDSAPALQRYIEGNLALVYPTAIYEKWSRLMAQGARADVPPFWYSIIDAEGRGIVVQVRDGVVQVLPNEYGAWTNEPFMQEHEKYLEEFEKKMFENPPDVFPSVKAVPVPELEEGGPSVFDAGSDGKEIYLPLPGGYSGPERFTRMALTLKYATNASCWNDDSLMAKGQKEKLNPAYVAPGLPTSNQALLAVAGISNQVYLPRGMSDHGKAGSGTEWTPFSALRDHTSKAYYIRAANSPLYRQYNFKEINWVNAGAQGIVTVPLTTPGETWFVKETI